MQGDILRNFRKVVTPQFISKIALQVKFNQKSTAQVSGIDFTRMLLMQISSGREMNYSNLNATLSKVNTHINISNQALSEYFYRESSVILIKSIYENVFSFQKEALMKYYKKTIDEKTLNVFDRIFIEDSTFCALNKKLATKYKGSGGSSSGASLKIDLIHELKTGATVKLTISQGNVPDTCLSNLILEELKSDDLVLRDLGYFTLSGMEDIGNKGAYFISRFRAKTNIHLSKESQEAIDIGGYLAKQYTRFPTQIVDVPIYLGETRLKLRLIGYKVPAEVANERRRKVRIAAVSKGRTPSKEMLDLCDYVILITNIEKEKLQAGVIGTIYRIRWSIELIFKTWKSHLNLQINLKGTKVTRIECFVYGTLIICLVTTLFYGWLRRMMGSIENEISLDKLSKWLVNQQGYVRLFWGTIAKLEKEIRKDLRQIRVQKRKRKTTLERVASREAYSEKYVVNF